MSYNKKEWKNVITFFAVFIIIVIFIFSNNDSSYYPNSYDNNEEQITDEFSNIQELHWMHMPLTYSFAESNRNIGPRDTFNYKCPDYQIQRLKDAFNMLQNETNSKILFEEVYDEEGEIIVYCYKLKADEGYYVEGEGGYISQDNLILNAELDFYDHLNCGTWPDVEIHEILHLFGYGHIENKSSIMTPIASRCDRGYIDEEIIQDLINTYSK